MRANKKAAAKKASPKRRKASPKSPKRRAKEAHIPVGFGVPLAPKAKPAPKKRKSRKLTIAQKAERAKKASKRLRSKFPPQYKTIAARAKRRVAFGPYKRVKLLNPATGRQELSFMYRKGGKLRKIPEWAIAGATSANEYRYHKGDFAKASGSIAKRRAAKAKSVRRRGAAFTPNRSAAQRRAGRRTAAYNKARKSGLRVAEAATAAVKAVPFTKTERAAGKSFKGVKTAAGGTVTKKRRRKARRKTSGKKKATRRKATRRRGGTKAARSRAAKKAARTRAAKKAARSKAAKKAATKRRRSGGRKRRAPTKRRRSTKRRPAMRANARRGSKRSRRKSRKGKRRSYRRNQFLADFRRVVRVGALVTVGFAAHKVVTAIGCEVIMRPLSGRVGGPVGDVLTKWERPICGGLVAMGGVWATQRFVKNPEARASIASGMVVSWLQSLVMTALDALGMGEWAARLEGVPSTAYQLQGDETSIMPRYAPTSGVGEYFAAQDGLGEYFAASGMGEYFAASGMGEYFASSGVAGVGNYEGAGPLAMQPSIQQAAAGRIDDGIRPDNAERALMLTEAAAGMGLPPPVHAYEEGVLGQFQQAAAGQFEQAAAGIGQVERVGTSSTWIPGTSDPSLWAGTISADDSQGESEIAAGILEGPGGSGILS